MVINLKSVFIKYCKDKESFNFFKAMGANVIELENPEEIDKNIEKLYKNNCKRIILTNEIAGFSEDIIKKYNSLKNIIIAPKK